MSSKVSPEFANRLQEFLQRPEVKQAAEEGTAGKNLGKLMDALTAALGTERKKLYLSGDIEGRPNNHYETLKAQGIIVRDPASGKMVFTDEASGFLFMGDLGGRGPAALRTAIELLSLKESAPSRVGFIWGNHDVGKLAMHGDLPALKNLSGDVGALYAQWLVKQLPENRQLGPAPARERLIEAVRSLNTDANRVQYWLESHGSPQALEFHRLGMEELSGKSVSVDEAARDYIQQWRPGGVFFRFLETGSFTAPKELIADSHFASHGGAARENITLIPGEDVLPNGLNEVIQGQYDLGRRLIAEAATDLQQGRPVSSTLLSLGDSLWMASENINAPRSGSFIYSQRNTQGGNLRGHEADVAAAMMAAGKQTEHVGHTPIGAIPEMRVGPEGTAKIFTDTSYVDDGSQSVIQVAGDMTMAMSHLGDAARNEVVFFAHKPGADTAFGKITSDGYAVAGMTLDGRYYLTKYEPGYKRATKTVSPEELQALDPRPLRPANSEDRLKTAQKVSGAIERKMGDWGAPILGFDGIDQIRGNRVPIVISSTARYGDNPATPEQVVAMSRSLKDAFGDNILIIDGGTSVMTPDGNKSPELIVQESFFPKTSGARTGGSGPKRVAAMPSVVNVDDFTRRPDALVIAGGPSDWHVPVVEASKYAGSRGGATVFIGGGGAVAKAIEAARTQPDTAVFLVRGRDNADIKGASDRVAREANLPPNFHAIYADELADLGPRIRQTTGNGLKSQANGG